MNLETINKKVLSIAILVLIFSVYLALSSASINEKQMVYGDMQTLYISERLSQGVKLYEEIEILYGPATYLIGSGFMGLGFTYSGLKIVMLTVSVISGILVFLIAQKVFNDYRIALLSTGIYMFIPIHYGIAPVFHPDSFAVLFMLSSIYFLLKNSKIGLILAATFSAIAIFTKIPVIPLVLAIIIYFIISRKKEGWLYASILFIIVIPGLFYIDAISENSDNTRFLFEKLLKDPDPPFSMLRDFFWIEGFVSLIAFLGIILYIKKTEKKSVLLVLALSSPLAFSAILLRGVGIYEANYMEPFIAIFASYMVFYIKDDWKFNQFISGKRIIPFVIVSLIIIQFAIFVYPDRERISDWDGNGRALEVNEIAEIHTVLLEKHTKIGDPVVASSMAVYKTGRTIPLDDPYLDLLKIKYELGYDSAIKKISFLEQKLEEKEIKMLITYNSTELSNQKYSSLQNQLFFPYYTKSFNDILDRNYEEFQEKGVSYFLPKI